jgi:ribosomal protein L7/L12
LADASRLCANPLDQSDPAEKACAKPTAYHDPTRCRPAQLPIPTDVAQMVTISETAIAFVSLLVVLVITIGSVRVLVADVQKRTRILGRVDAKLDLLLKHAGIEYDPYKDLPREIVDAVQRGEKIRAIKRYREATGVGLREARDFIEGLQRRAGV